MTRDVLYDIGWLLDLFGQALDRVEAAHEARSAPALAAAVRDGDAIMTFLEHVGGGSARLQ